MDVYHIITKFSVLLGIYVLVFGICMCVRVFQEGAPALMEKLSSIPHLSPQEFHDISVDNKYDIIDTRHVRSWYTQAMNLC